MINNVLSVNFDCMAELHRSDSQQTFAMSELALTYFKEKPVVVVLFPRLKLTWTLQRSFAQPRVTPPGNAALKHLLLSPSHV